MPLGVKALATFPLKSAKRDKGLRDVPVSFAGVTVRPGDWVYADKVRGGQMQKAPMRRRGRRRAVPLLQRCSTAAHPSPRLRPVWQPPAVLRCCIDGLPLARAALVQDGIIVSPEELTL